MPMDAIAHKTNPGVKSKNMMRKSLNEVKQRDTRRVAGVCPASVIRRQMEKMSPFSSGIPNPISRPRGSMAQEPGPVH
jgi:hypothetical protein